MKLDINFSNSFVSSQPENFTTQRKDCNNDSIANGLEQAQTCGRVKLINRIPILLS